MDTREEATAFLRKMEAQHPTDWLNRSLWPAEERTAYEAWEARELDRKAEAERQEAAAREVARAAAEAAAREAAEAAARPVTDESLREVAEAEVDALAPDPLPVTPPEPGAPGDQRGGR